MSQRAGEPVASVAFSQILEGYGIDAVAHPQLSSGEPDVFVQNRGSQVVIELKKTGSGQRDLLLSQMEERLEEGMGDVVFGVLFPKEIVDGGIATPSVDSVKTDLHDATLEVWVQTAPHTTVDPSSSFSAQVSDFTDLIPRFTGQLLAGEELDKTVKEVSDAAHGFVSDLMTLQNSESIARNIEEVLEGLGDSPRDPGDEMSEEEVQEYLVSGGLILFNATAFYELLAQNKNVKPLRRRVKESGGVWRRTLSEAFDDALEINYDSVFLTANAVIDILPSSHTVENALEEIHEASESVLSRAGLLRQDLTGRVYHSALGQTLADNYATYYTKIPSGELLAWLGVRDWDAKVGDFACGSGTLLTSSYHRKMSLAFDMVEVEGESEEEVVNVPQASADGYSGISEIHKKFVEDDVWGLDAMSFASHLTAVNLALQQPEVTFEQSHVYQVPVTNSGQSESRLGSLDLLDSSEILVQSRLEGESTIGAGEQSMDETEVKHLSVPKGEFDLVIMNPPFSRADRAVEILNTGELNSVLRNEFPDRDYANTTRAGLAAPFTILADNIVAEGGRMALVVPSSILSRETWQPIRDFLNENYHLEHIVVNWAHGEPAFSEDTELREVLLVARKLESGETGTDHTLLTHLDRDIDFMQSRLIGNDLVEEINPRRVTFDRPRPDPIMDGVTQLGVVKSAQKSLTVQTADNWYRLVAFRDQDLVKLMLSIEGYLNRSQTPYGINLPDAFSTLGDEDGLGDVNLYVKNKKAAGYAYADDEVEGSDPIVVSSRYKKFGATPGEDGQWIYRDPSLEVREKFDYGVGELLVMRRMDMFNTMRVCSIAPDEDVQFTGSMWIPIEMESMTTTDGRELEKVEVARIISAWLNSSFGMIPYIGYRAETRGAFAEWKVNQVRRITALDPSKLSSGQAQKMLDAYSEHRHHEWGLLKNQLEEVQEDEDHPRRQLDEDVANAVFESAEDVEYESLYEDFENTLNLLGGLMD
jgi:hypothetical protein